MVDVHVRYVLAHFMAMASVCLLLHFIACYPLCLGHFRLDGLESSFNKTEKASSLNARAKSLQKLEQFRIFI